MAVSRWSQAARPVHFFWIPIPAYAVLPFMLFIFHIRLWTLALTLLTIGVLTYLSYRGRTPQWIARRLQVRLRAGGMVGRPTWYRRRTQMQQSLDAIALPAATDSFSFATAPSRAPSRTSPKAKAS